MALCAAALAAPSVPLASAQPCPDVELVFARGTTEPPGVGGIGQAFVDAVRAKAAPRTVEVYAVDYPASLDFPTARDGVIDADARVRATAANCPDTKVVLGGYSQGAAVVGYLTTDGAQTPPEVADQIAAVALFGKPSNAFLRGINAPPLDVGARFAAKTVDECAGGDPICTPGGDNNAAHGLYAVNGMVDAAADFAVQRL